MHDGGQAAVGLHAEVVAGDVIPGDGGGDRHVDGDLGRGLGRRLAGQLGDGLGDHLAVEVEADGGDVAALLAAEEVAGAPDLEVTHGDLEAGAEVGELAERLEPFVGLLRQHPVLGVEQVGVGPLPGPAHPAS